MSDSDEFVLQPNTKKRKINTKTTPSKKFKVNVTSVPSPSANLVLHGDFTAYPFKAICFGKTSYAKSILPSKQMGHRQTAGNILHGSAVVGIKGANVKQVMSHVSGTYVLTDNVTWHFDAKGAVKRISNQFGVIHKIVRGHNGGIFFLTSKGALNHTGSTICGFNFPQIQDAAFGYRHGLAISYNGTLYGGGDNDLGQLDSIGKNFSPTSAPVSLDCKKVEAIACGSQFSAVSADGKLFVTGTAEFCTPGWSELKVSNVVELCAGTTFFVHRQQDNQVGIFGSIYHKEKLLKKGFPALKKISCGNDYIMGVTPANTVVAFGKNHFSYLGRSIWGSFQEFYRIGELDSNWNIDLTCSDDQAMVGLYLRDRKEIYPLLIRHSHREQLSDILIKAQH